MASQESSEADAGCPASAPLRSTRLVPGRLVYRDGPIGGSSRPYGSSSCGDEECRPAVRRAQPMPAPLASARDQHLACDLLAIGLTDARGGCEHRRDQDERRRNSKSQMSATDRDVGSSGWRTGKDYQH